MLVIRPEQIRTFEEVLTHRFENEMISHLRKFAPHHCEIVGEQGMRRLIQLGQRQAEDHGLTWRGPVRSYIEIMVMFGSHIFTDPQYSWAGAILADSENSGQVERCERLREKTLDYCDKVIGPNFAYEKKAIREYLRQRTSNNWSAAASIPELLQRLRVIYPEKCAYVGEGELVCLVQETKQIAERHNLTTNAGMIALLTLTFAFGHGVLADPQYSWAVVPLQDPKLADPAQRTDKLSARIALYFERALANHI